MHGECKEMTMQVEWAGVIISSVPLCQRSGPWEGTHRPGESGRSLGGGRPC